MRLAFTADPPGCPALQVLVSEVAMEELNEIIDVLFQINTAAPLFFQRGQRLRVKFSKRCSTSSRHRQKSLSRSERALNPKAQARKI